MSWRSHSLTSEQAWAGLFELITHSVWGKCRSSMKMTASSPYFGRRRSVPHSSICAPRILLISLIVLLPFRRQDITPRDFRPRKDPVRAARTSADVVLSPEPATQGISPASTIQRTAAVCERAFRVGTRSSPEWFTQAFDHSGSGVLPNSHMVKFWKSI